MSHRSVNVPSRYYDREDGIDHCPSCAQPRFEHNCHSSHFGLAVDFYRCQCGLYKQVPMPNELFFEWFFNSELFFSSKKSGHDEVWGFYDYFADELSRLKTSRRRYARLSKVLNWGKGRSMMKIGPSTGTFLYVARENGQQAIGCDVSNEFVEYARENYDVRIDHGRFESLGYAPESFDEVLMFNVVENVPNLEELLSEISRTLKVGGHLILNHVEMKRNFLSWLQRERYFIFRPPVCYVFEGRALDRLLARHGLKVKKRLRDIRYLHVEKMATLLRWRWLHRLGLLFGVSRVNFPIWAYPSWITIAEKQPGEMDD